MKTFLFCIEYDCANVQMCMPHPPHLTKLDYILRQLTRRITLIINTLTSIFQIISVILYAKKCCQFRLALQTTFTTSAVILCKTVFVDPQSGSGSDKIVFSHLITPLNYEKIFSLPKYRVGSRSYRIQIQYAVFTDEQNIFEIFLKILAFPRAFFILNATAERLIGRKSESLIFLPFLSTSHVARKL